jgi:hypothetical protein
MKEEISNQEVVKVKFTKHSLKNQAHEYFDKLWKLNYITRAEAYQYLAEWLGVPEMKAHMSSMDNDTCKKVIEYSIQMLNDNRRLDLDFGAPIKTPYYELVIPEIKGVKTE